jgi:hypothetical protein
MGKFIVSTTGFRHHCRRAIDNKTTLFRISEHMICFEGKETIEVNIHTDNSFLSEQYVGRFNPVTWYMMMQFLKQLEEQPMTIEVAWYAHTKVHEEPEFDLQGFSKRF